LLIPSLKSTQHLYNGPDDDFTWFAAAPIAWIQASLSLSVITVCIPSIKVIFDSFFDNGTHMAIDMPYELRAVPGKAGFQATAYAKSSSYAKNGSLKLTSRTQSQGMGGAAAINDGKMNDDGQSESVRNLTEGIIVREDIEIQFDDQRSSSPDGSQVSSQQSHHAKHPTYHIDIGRAN
jgi:hypothetical protein